MEHETWNSLRLMACSMAPATMLYSLSSMSQTAETMLRNPGKTAMAAISMGKAAAPVDMTQELSVALAHVDLIPADAQTIQRLRPLLHQQPHKPRQPHKQQLPLLYRPQPQPPPFQTHRSEEHT